MNNYITLHSRNQQSEKVGFIKEPVYKEESPKYSIKLKHGDESDSFGIFLNAIYNNITFRASVDIYGVLHIFANSSCRRVASRKKEEDAIYIPLGLELNPDREEYSKKASFEECSEVYEIRKDYIVPKGFIPGETKELRGGYTVTDYNLEKDPFITSRKTIYKDGVKLTEFVEDLW
jgi:hypothetical protein